MFVIQVCADAKELLHMRDFYIQVHIFSDLIHSTALANDPGDQVSASFIQYESNKNTRGKSRISGCFVEMQR